MHSCFAFDEGAPVPICSTCEEVLRLKLPNQLTVPVGPSRVHTEHAGIKPLLLQLAVV